MALLEVKDLTIEFLSEGKRLSTVTDISFHLERGELLALVGESGVGKTTVINMVIGYHFPDSGLVTIDGHICM